MRNDDDPAAEGVYTSAVARRARRRRRSLIGAAGALSVLGVGGLIAAQVMDDRDTAPAGRIGALEPPATVVIPSIGPSFDPVPIPSETVVPSATAMPPASAAAAPRAASPTTAPAAPPPTTASQRAAAPRSTSPSPAADQTRRPGGGNAATVTESGVTTRTERGDGETLRISSARRDLTGYKELGWVADEGRKVGNARCSNKIRISADVDATERPSLLLCWRTSADKSVYTLAIKTNGQPSATASVAAINREWAKLG